MSYEKMLEQVLDHLQFIGNTEEEATEILAGLLHDATMTLPQRGWYDDKYCALKREQKNTAKIELRKLPNGKEILEHEEKFLRIV